jgi:predicted N-acyltransferase
LEEYLARLSRRDRNRRKRELQAMREGGVTIEWTRVTPELTDRAACLITQNRARYGGSADEAWMRRSFTAQRAAGVLDNAYASLAMRNGQLLGLTVFYGRGERLHARYFGYNYAGAKPSGEYFVLSYQTPLHHAAKAGFRHLHLGVSAWRSKVLRGATLFPLAIVILPVTGQICSPGHAARHNADAVRAWRRLSPRRDAYSPAWEHWNSVKP